jgi:hypothetical protein
MFFIIKTTMNDVTDGSIISGTDLRLSDIQALTRTATIKLSYGLLTEMSVRVRGHVRRHVRGQDELCGVGA